MSWLQFQNQPPTTTEDEAELWCDINPPDALIPAASWNFSLNHTIETKDPATNKRASYWNLDIAIENLFFHESDWRRLSNHSIRADSAWQDHHEYISHLGHVVRSRIEARLYACTFTPDNKPAPTEHAVWAGENYILRFGNRDGRCFPIELDAWLLPQNEWDRTQAEDPREAARFPETPPNLRIITAAWFIGGRVEVPRCGLDPHPKARRLIQQAIGLDNPEDLKTNWDIRFNTDYKTHTRPEGWRSTVVYRVSD